MSESPTSTLNSPPVANSHENLRHPHTPWTPGKASNAPFLAIAALLTVALCTAATITVLSVSNGQQTSSWLVEPSVLLAILVTVLNTAFAFVLSAGITITWWKAALHGTTLGDLHRYWDFGSSWLGLLACGGKHFNRIALGNIMSLLILLDGPLLQKASQSQTKTIPTNTTILVKLAQRIPQNFTGLGVMDPADENTFPLSNIFRYTISNYHHNAPITVSNSGCSSTCQSTIPAAGIAFNCTTHEWTHDFFQDDKTRTFDVKLGWDNSTSYRAGLLYAQSATVGLDNIGNVTTRYCSFRTAIINYPVKLENDTLSFTESPFVNLTDKEQQSRVAKFVDGDVQSGTLLDGLMRNAFTFYAGAHANLAWTGINYTEPLNTEYFAYTATFERFQNPLMFSDNSSNEDFASAFDDPTESIFMDLGSITFRLAQNAYPYSNSLTSTAPAVEAVNQLLFHTDFRYMSAAVAVILLGVIGLLPTLWGWWELGRVVSLSPIEIAKAFGAPLLHEEGSDGNATAEKLVKVFGARRVRYGEVEVRQGVESNSEGSSPSSSPKGRLLFSDADAVMEPVKGKIYS